MRFSYVTPSCQGMSILHEYNQHTKKENIFKEINLKFKN